VRRLLQEDTAALRRKKQSTFAATQTAAASPFGHPGSVRKLLALFPTELPPLRDAGPSVGAPEGRAVSRTWPEEAPTMVGWLDKP
jgi:hypothetical protein